MKPEFVWLWYHEELDAWQWCDDDCTDGLEDYVFIGEYERKEKGTKDD